TAGTRDRSACTATNRSEKSTGTIIRQRYWIPSARLLNGTMFLPKSYRKCWGHTGPFAGAATWPNLSARTSRIGGGSVREPTAHEHLKVDETAWVMKVTSQGKGGAHAR